MNQLVNRRKPAFQGIVLRLLILVVAAFIAVAAAAPKAKPVKLPVGPGQALVQTKCATCHPLTMVVTKRKTQDQWYTSLDQMTSKGLRLTDDEYDSVAAYLAKNFGPKK